MTASAIYFLGGTPYAVEDLNVLYAKHAQRIANERWGANWPDTNAMSLAELRAFVKDCQQINREAGRAVATEVQAAEEMKR